MFDVSTVVRNKASIAGVPEWVEGIPGLVAELAAAWDFTAVRQLEGGTEAFVLAVVRGDGTPAVLKLLVPRDTAAAHEITVLTLVDGDGGPRLYEHDPDRGALLMERLGPSMFELAIPWRRRHELLCATAARLWRPAPDCGLPTGAEKGRWLIGSITSTWEAVDRPVPESVIDDAITCAERRIAAHDDERAQLVHGDVHQWNALRSGNGRFTLVDPDGLLTDPEYDLGIIMREDPVELLEEGPWSRAHRLARLTGLDPRATWEWGVVERVSTGLLCTSIGLQPFGRDMLAAAVVVASL